MTFYITATNEGKHTHYYTIKDGRMEPLSDSQVHELRLAGIEILPPLPDTAVLEKAEKDKGTT